MAKKSIKIILHDFGLFGILARFCEDYQRFFHEELGASSLYVGFRPESGFLATDYSRFDSFVRYESNMSRLLLSTVCFKVVLHIK